MWAGQSKCRWPAHHRAFGRPHTARLRFCPGPWAPPAHKPPGAVQPLATAAARRGGQSRRHRQNQALAGSWGPPIRLRARRCRSSPARAGLGLQSGGLSLSSRPRWSGPLPSGPALHWQCEASSCLGVAGVLAPAQRVALARHCRQTPRHRPACRPTEAKTRGAAQRFQQSTLARRVPWPLPGSRLHGHPIAFQALAKSLAWECAPCRWCSRAVAFPQSWGSPCQCRGMRLQKPHQVEREHFGVLTGRAQSSAEPRLRRYDNDRVRYAPVLCSHPSLEKFLQGNW